MKKIIIHWKNTPMVISISYEIKHWSTTTMKNWKLDINRISNEWKMLWKVGLYDWESKLDTRNSWKFQLKQGVEIRLK